MQAKSSSNIRFKNTFNEIVVANFGELQIVVPTLRQVVQKRVFSATVNVPHRIYDSEGWLLQGGDAIAALQNLTIASIFAPETPCPAIERIGPAIPLRFEVTTMEPLPKPASRLSSFSCQLPDALHPYLTVFCNMRPRFARVYPFAGTSSLTLNVADMQQQERKFVRENSERLQSVPFYREQFKL